MATKAVKNNALRDSSNKISSSTSGKRQKNAPKLDKSSSNSGKSGKNSSSKRSNNAKGGKKGSQSKESNSKKSKDSNSNSTRDSSKKKKSASKSGKSSKSKSRADTIKLSCGRDVYYVSARHFAACSNLIKKELSVNAHARSVDLRQFDKTTVRVLSEYIESKKIKTDISFYSLAELLKFSKVFEMDNLRLQLEKFITVIAANDLSTLHQVLLIIGITPVTLATERIILEKAAKQFTELAETNTFQRIPFNIIITLFARCDLNVKSEVQVVDAMLLWLAGQPNLPSVVPSLFYLIRHDFLHPIQKAFILERARALRFPDDVVSIIDRCFECENGSRICVIREHYDAHYTRCGIADASQQDAKTPDMPLSLPRDAILYKPPSEQKEQPSFDSAGARPYYHGAPACAGGKSKKSVAKPKSNTAGKKKGSGTKNSSRNPSRSATKSTEKSGSNKRVSGKKGSTKSSSKSGSKRKVAAIKKTAAKPPPPTQ